MPWRKRPGYPPCPRWAYYDSPEVNAFATGPTKSRSLVAVSTGLLRRMDKDEVEGVLGHEIAHIANGDMVTMTLLQGLINAFVMFLARIIAMALAARGGRDEERSSGRQFLRRDGASGGLEPPGIPGGGLVLAPARIPRGRRRRALRGQRARWWAPCRP